MKTIFIFKDAIEQRESSIKNIFSVLNQNHKSFLQAYSVVELQPKYVYDSYIKAETFHVSTWKDPTIDMKEATSDQMKSLLVWNSKRNKFAYEWAESFKNFSDFISLQKDSTGSA